MFKAQYEFKYTAFLITDHMRVPLQFLLTANQPSSMTICF